MRVSTALMYVRISIATVISFTARGLSTTNIFCYQAVVSAGVTLILPGYVIRKSTSVSTGLTMRSQSAVLSSLQQRILSLALCEWYTRSFTRCFWCVQSIRPEHTAELSIIGFRNNDRVRPLLCNRPQSQIRSKCSPCRLARFHHLNRLVHPNEHLIFILAQRHYQLPACPFQRYIHILKFDIFQRRCELESWTCGL